MQRRARVHRVLACAPPPAELVEKVDEAELQHVDDDAAHTRPRPLLGGARPGQVVDPPREQIVRALLVERRVKERHYEAAEQSRADDTGGPAEQLD